MFQGFFFFFNGFSDFPLSSKINIFKLSLDPMQDIPQNHFRVKGDSWENIINCYLLLFDLEYLSHTTSFEKGSLIEQ